MVWGRNQKREAHELLYLLKEESPNTGAGDFSVRARQIEEFLDTHEAPSNSRLRDELRWLREDARELFENQTPEVTQTARETPTVPEFIPDFAKGKREFVGMSGRHKIYVTAEYDQISLSRLYGQRTGRRITMFWDFNSAGRIETMRSMIFDARQERQLIIVPEDNSKDPNWIEATAQTQELPPEIKEIDQGLYFERKPWKQYQTLLRYGSGMAHELVENLWKDNVKQSDGDLKRNQIPLTRIVNDQTAVFMLDQCTRVIPEVWEEGSGLVTIKYAPNPEYNPTPQ
ncbi:MAG: hypothetical protein ABIH92_03920 [Nanoarchaeota archaeon]